VKPGSEFVFDVPVSEFGAGTYLLKIFHDDQTYGETIIFQ